MPDNSSRLLSTALLGLLCVTPLAAQTSDSKEKCSPPRPIHQEDITTYRQCGKYDCVALLDVLVDKEGNVSDANISSSSGNDRYDRDALKVVKKWKFAPSICDGQANPAHIVIHVQVHAQGSR